MISRRKFLTRIASAASVVALSSLYPYIVPRAKPSVPSVWGQPAPTGVSSIYSVEGYSGPVNGRHIAIQRLLRLMASNGLPFLKSSTVGLVNGPDGLIGSSDVVMVKVNCQWEERGGTNTDLVRELIQTILDHPDGFAGEIVVVDNGQGRGRFDWPSANAEDITQDIQRVVDSFASQGFRASTFLWDTIRATRTSEYSEGAVDDGYILEDDVEPEIGMRLNYPKFRTAFGTFISLKNGIWDPDSGSYSTDRLKLINFPVLKSHGGAGVTACIKHYMGIVSQSMQDNHPFIFNGGLAAEMALVRFPTLNILDAIYVNPHPLESGNAGPYTPYSRAARVNQVAASLDPAALDYWASKNILVPLAKSLGHSSAQSLDPDSPNQTFHDYLVNSVNALLASNVQSTIDPSRMTVFVDRHTDGSTAMRSKSSLGDEFSGVRVKVEWRESGRRRTRTLTTPFSLDPSAQGMYRFTAPSTARVNGVQYRFAYWKDETGATLSGSKTLSYNVQSGKTLYAVYEPRQYTLTVHVKDSTTHVSVRGATVEVSQLGHTYTAVTNSRGRAVVRGVYAGQPVTLTITKDGYQRFTITIVLTRNTRYRAYLAPV